MIAGTKTANAVGGKTARACDSCVRKRARWYCAADDAFLCHSCDGSVHSANQLASRHERVLLEAASSKLSIPSPEPMWHQGLTRKPRTPRQRTKSSSLKLEGRNLDATNSSVRLVPEMGAIEASLLDDDDDEEEFLYRVPVFDPFEAELCDASNDLAGRSLSYIVEDEKDQETCNLDDLQLGFDVQTDDLELMEFAADVESLLGKGFDDTTSCRNIDDLGLISTNNNNYKQEYNNTNNGLGICFHENRVKVEEAILGFDDSDAISRETVLNCEFDYHESPTTMMMIIKEEEEEEEKAKEEEEHMMMQVKKSSSIILRLNYEDVISVWADQGSPWTDGIRPQLDISDASCWPADDSMESQWLMDNNNPSYRGGGGGDGGREARVSRYREKRRTRLFSKKIRYEVRKLNAEKRPRMKGRFVKRELITCFKQPPTPPAAAAATSSFPTYNFINS